MYVNLLQKTIARLFAIIIIPIAIIVIPVLNALGLNKVDLESGDVLDYLHKMKNGEVDDYWWDDFLSVPIKNEALDQIRESCSEVN